MKILKLVIKNPHKEIIRDIDFSETGISFIYGDIQEPTNKKATINSLGKTLLLKYIDYIYGANEDKKVVGEVLAGYILDAVVLFENKKYDVRRILGESQKILIEGKVYNLTEYKHFFKIKRSLYSKQLIVNKKSTEISYSTRPDKLDVTTCLRLLNLLKLVDDIESIYDSQDRIKALKEQKKEVVSFYGNWDVNKIDEEIFYVDKEVERLREELEKISVKIKKIEVSDLQQNVIEEYADKGKKLKELKREYEKRRTECERLEEFIQNSKKNDLTSEHLLLIYEKAKQEVPEMVKKELKEVEAFHNKVYKEREAFLGEKRNQLLEEMDGIDIELKELAERVDTIGRIISTNEVYQESIELYSKYNSDLQELVYKQGKLSQIKNVDNAIDEEKNSLADSFNNASQIRKTYEELVLKYRNFVFSLIKSIYDKEVNSFFDIKVRQFHSTTRPVSFEFSIKGDTGEGVSEVKKNLMDYLICRYNTAVNVMLQDSACYNGIDPRQVAGMLIELGKIAEETNKQVIVAVNKYQVTGYDEVIKYIIDNHAVILSENDKLMKFDF